MEFAHPNHQRTQNDARRNVFPKLKVFTDATPSSSEAFGHQHSEGNEKFKHPHSGGPMYSQDFLEGGVADVQSRQSGATLPSLLLTHIEDEIDNRLEPYCKPFKGAFVSMRWFAPGGQGEPTFECLNTTANRVVQAALDEGGDVVRVTADGAVVIWPCDTTSEDVSKLLCRAVQFGVQFHPEAPLRCLCLVSAGSLMELHAGGVSGKWHWNVGGPCAVQIAAISAALFDSVNQFRSDGVYVPKEVWNSMVARQSAFRTQEMMLSVESSQSSVKMEPYDCRDDGNVRTDVETTNNPTQEGQDGQSTDFPSQSEAENHCISVVKVSDAEVTFASPMAIGNKKKAKKTRSLIPEWTKYRTDMISSYDPWDWNFKSHSSLANKSPPDITDGTNTSSVAVVVVRCPGLTGAVSRQQEGALLFGSAGGSSEASLDEDMFTSAVDPQRVKTFLDLLQHAAAHVQTIAKRYGGVMAYWDTDCTAIGFTAMVVFGLSTNESFNRKEPASTPSVSADSASFLSPGRGQSNGSIIGSGSSSSFDSRLDATRASLSFVRGLRMRIPSAAGASYGEAVNIDIGSSARQIKNVVIGNVVLEALHAASVALLCNSDFLNLTTDYLNEVTTLTRSQSMRGPSGTSLELHRNSSTSSLVDYECAAGNTPRTGSRTNDVTGSPPMRAGNKREIRVVLCSQELGSSWANHAVISACRCQKDMHTAFQQAHVFARPKKRRDSVTSAATPQPNRLYIAPGAHIENIAFSVNGMYRNNNDSTVYLITGEPGSGKSRFLREVQRALLHSNADVKYVFQNSRPASVLGVFGMWELIVAEITGLRGVALVDEMVQICLGNPGLSSLIGAIPIIFPAALDDDSEGILAAAEPIKDIAKGRTLLCGILQQLISKTTVIAIDDCQTQSPAFWSALRLLSREIKGAIFLLTVMGGSQTLSECKEVESWDHGHIVELQPLNLEESKSFMQAKFGCSVIDDVTTDLTYSLTRGNPKMIENVCKTLLEANVVGVFDGRLQHISEGNDQTLQKAVARAVKEAGLPAWVDVTLATSDAVELAVLDAASVIEKAFGARQLAALTNKLKARLMGESMLSISAALNNLTERGLLVKMQPTSSNSENKYDFKEEVMRELIYERIPASVKAELHQSYAQYLEDSGAGSSSLATLANHWGLGGMSHVAISYFERAAVSAFGMGNYKTSAELYSELIRIGSVEEVKNVVVAGWSLERGVCLSRLGLSGAALQAIQSAARLLNEDGAAVSATTKIAVVNRILELSAIAPEFSSSSRTAASWRTRAMTPMSEGNISSEAKDHVQKQASLGRRLAGSFVKSHMEDQERESEGLNLAWRVLILWSDELTMANDGIGALGCAFRAACLAKRKGHEAYYIGSIARIAIHIHLIHGFRWYARTLGQRVDNTLLSPLPPGKAAPIALLRGTYHFLNAEWSRADIMLKRAVMEATSARQESVKQMAVLLRAQTELVRGNFQAALLLVEGLKKSLGGSGGVRICVQDTCSFEYKSFQPHVPLICARFSNILTFASLWYSQFQCSDIRINVMRDCMYYVTVLAMSGDMQCVEFSTMESMLSRLGDSNTQEFAAIASVTSLLAAVQGSQEVAEAYYTEILLRLSHSPFTPVFVWSGAVLGRTWQAMARVRRANDSSRSIAWDIPGNITHSLSSYAVSAHAVHMFDAIRLFDANKPAEGTEKLLSTLAVALQNGSKWDALAVAMLDLQVVSQGIIAQSDLDLIGNMQSTTGEILRTVFSINRRLRCRRALRMCISLVKKFVLMALALVLIVATAVGLAVILPDQEFFPHHKELLGIAALATEVLMCFSSFQNVSMLRDCLPLTGLSPI